MVVFAAVDETLSPTSPRRLDRHDAEPFVAT
jgi:hypothetical protein